jgi:hypothetical protein
MSIKSLMPTLNEAALILSKGLVIVESILCRSLRRRNPEDKGKGELSMVSPEPLFRIVVQVTNLNPRKRGLLFVIPEVLSRASMALL